MATSFIGKPISIISHSDVRYRGILAGINPEAATIQLSHVYSLGTEQRRPAHEFIAPVPEPYTYIVFRASEVKDLSVEDQPPPTRNVHDDPAVIGASSAPGPQQLGQYPSGYPQQPVVAQQAGFAPQQATTPSPMQNVTAPIVNGAAPSGRANSVQTATASLQNVERAIGDLRANNNTGGRGGGGRRGGHHNHHNHHNNAANEIEVPPTDFDFQSSNARFDKSALSNGTTNTDENSESENNKDELKAYNPQKSFFDTLSSGQAQSGGGGRGGGGGRRGGSGGGGQGRNRREEERERNVATFGEPGGIGLMGPGAYVGGWGGGYNRRGGGRGRRGGGAGGAR